MSHLCGFLFMGSTDAHGAACWLGFVWFGSLASFDLELDDLTNFFLFVSGELIDEILPVLETDLVAVGLRNESGCAEHSYRRDFQRTRKRE